MKLKEWSPIKNADWVNKKTRKYLDNEVVKVYGQFECRKDIEETMGFKLSDDNDAGWDLYLQKLSETTFTHQNIYSFVLLDNDKLVGFNESPSHGWSFPVGKWKIEQ